MFWTPNLGIGWARPALAPKEKGPVLYLEFNGQPDGPVVELLGVRGTPVLNGRASLWAPALAKAFRYYPGGLGRPRLILYHQNRTWKEGEPPVITDRWEPHGDVWDLVVVVAELLARPHYED